MENVYPKYTRRAQAMATLDGKRVGQVVRLGGSGMGQILVAHVVPLLVALFSGPGPAILLDYVDEQEEYAGEGVEDEEDGAGGGNVHPGTIWWPNITCSLSDKSSKSVRFLLKNVTREQSVEGCWSWWEHQARERPL